MNVLHVASEVAPLSQTGGLGEVVGALPQALYQIPDVHPCVVSARYGSMRPADYGLMRRLRKIAFSLGTEHHEVEVWEGRLPAGQTPLYLIEHPLFSGREGIYGPPDQPGRDYPDNALRFALLSRAALAVAQAFDRHPHVVHAHDWQASLALHFARRLPQGVGEHRRAPATVLTVHNLAYQGRFPLDAAQRLGLGDADLSPEGIEFYGEGSLLKAGLLAADRITTVSPRYAREILTPEQGCGLSGLLTRLQGRLSGILNGVDYDRWNPAADPFLAANYGGHKADADDDDFASALAGKALCKADLQRDLNLLHRPRAALCATIAPLYEDRGIELLLEVLEGDEIWRSELQFVLLGHGDGPYADRLRVLQRRRPGRVLHLPGSGSAAGDERLTHRLIAAADFTLNPARIEPCGQHQIHSLRYGTIPIVRATGGLDDSVVDFDPHSRSGTGFKFGAYAAPALYHAWRRALSAYEGPPAPFQGLIRRAMRQDLGWAAAARAYHTVYQQALAR